MVLYNSTYRVQRCYVRAFWYELDVFSDDSQIETAVSALALDIRQRLQLLLVLFHNFFPVEMATKGASSNLGPVCKSIGA